MPTFNFTSPDGQKYKVNGPEGATEEQAFKILQNQLASQPPPPPPNAGMDMLKALPTGLAQGAAYTAGLPGTVSDLISSGLDKGMNALTGADVHTNKSRFSGEALYNDLDKSVGGFYQPQTGAGKFAQTAASFVPAAFGGEASLAQRALSRVLAPAAGSMAGGAAFDENEHPYLHTAGQLVGALLGGGAAAGVGAGVRAAAKDAAPELTADRYLGQIAKQNEVTPESITANAIPDRGQLGAEAMGPQGVAMLATLGRRGGTTAEALSNALTTRAAGAPSRIMDDFSEAAGIHPEAARGNIDTLVDAGRAAVKPLFDKALSLPGGVMTNDLAELLKRPIIKKSMAQAAEDIRNGGGDPTRYGLFFDEAGNATQVSHPTAEAWDLVKKAVGNSVERDAFGKRLPDSASPGNVRISQASQSLTKAMSDAIPGYGEAVEKSGDYLSLQSAFETGQKHILDLKTTPAQVAKHVAGMTPAEVNAYKAGIANKMFNDAQNMRLAPRLLNTSAVQGKLTAALGEQNAQTFMDGLQKEMSLAKTGGRMMPGTGSISSDVLLGAGDQDHAANLAALLQAGKAGGQALSGNFGSAALTGVNAIRHFAPDFLKSGGMSPEVRNQLGKLLSLPPEDLAAELRRIQAGGGAPVGASGGAIPVSALATALAGRVNR